MNTNAEYRTALEALARRGELDGLNCWANPKPFTDETYKSQGQAEAMCSGCPALGRECKTYERVTNPQRGDNIVINGNSYYEKYEEPKIEQEVEVEW